MSQRHYEMTAFEWSLIKRFLPNKRREIARGGATGIIRPIPRRSAPPCLDR